MVEIGGQCTVNGNPVEGAKIWVVDPSAPSVVATTTSDASGNWSLDISTGQTVHVVSRYEDDSGKRYNAKSYPFISV